MVKVHEELAMAQPRSTAAQAAFNHSLGSINNNYACANGTAGLNKQCVGPNYPHHHHYQTSQQHQHQHTLYYHHQCAGHADGGGGDHSRVKDAPAKFYLGPGFEPQAQIPGGAFAQCPTRAQNGSEHVVLFHVNPGVIISFQMGENVEILRGPVTVPMVSTNASPPMAMPVNVPPGHMVQQIVNESGTLGHVIISLQHPTGLVSMPSHNSQNYGDTNGTTQAQRNLYQNLQTNFSAPPAHIHTTLSTAPHAVTNTPCLGPSPPPPIPAYYKDERTQKQHSKLKKKLYDKQTKGEPPILSNIIANSIGRESSKEKGVNSVETSEDGEESSIQDEEDSINIITEILSSVQAPTVSDLSPRSALLQWAPPTRLGEASCNDSLEYEISESDLIYEVLLSDKSKEMKFKSIYHGVSLSCRVRDLKPGQEYSVCLQVHYGELQGSATDPIVKFTTPSCEPDRPLPPKIVNPTKNSIQLKWTSTNDNGSQIQCYILEYDDGTGEFVEAYKSRGKQHTLQKLRPSTLYKFRLAAVNGIGKSMYSDVVGFRTLDNPPTAPNPPTLVEATVNSLHLQWNRRIRDDEFVLQLDDPANAYGYINVYNGNDTHYQCGRLHHFTNYKFRLRAQNDSGASSWSQEVQYATLPDRPSAPSKPTVKGKIHAYSFKLRWDPPAYSGGATIENYILEINTGSGYKIAYTGKETEAVCDKLTPGTTYQLRVCCISRGGYSNYSDPCVITTDATCPGQCPIPKLCGKPKSDTISIAWSEPDYNGGAPILEYEISLGTPLAEDELVFRNKEKDYTVGALEPGCEYSFKVRAINRVGCSIWSDALVTKSSAAPPNAPDAPTLVCKSPFEVSTRWEAPSCNGSPITGYRLELNSVGEDAPFECVYEGLESSHDIRNITPSSTYYFKVQAGNSAGYSVFSPTSSITSPPAAPGVVSSLRYIASPTSFNLSWNEANSNGSPILYYNIEIGDRLISTEEPVKEFTIDSLNAETHYKIRVQAVNEVGEGLFSSVLRATTTRFPPSPPKLRCVGVGHNYLKLKWGEGKNNDYTQYCIECFNPRSRDFHCVYKGTSFTCKVNKLQELTTYRFRINASNDTGEGDFSHEYEFATTISPPSALKPPKIVELEDKTCMVEWIPAKNIFSDPLNYELQVSRNDGAFISTYKGSETKYHLAAVEEGVKYGFRVCPIRLTSSGELLGTFTTAVNFLVPVSKVAPEVKQVAKTAAVCAQSNKTRNLIQTVRQIYNSSMMTERQCHFAYATCLTIFCIVVAIMSTTLYDYWFL